MRLLLNQITSLSPNQLWALIKEPARLFTLSAVLVNAGNYAYNVWLGRALSPELFAEAVLLVTLLLALSFLATGIQLTVAKFCAELDGLSQEEGLAFLSKLALILGVGIGGLIIAFASPLASLFAMSDASVFYPLGAAIPFYLWLSVSRGKAQGSRDYLGLALTYQLEMLARFALTIMAIQWLNWTPSWSVAAAIAGSIVLSAIARPTKLRLSSGFGISKALQKRIVIFFLYLCLYECLQIICSNADMLMVKHYFKSETAGQYGAMALIGRIVFFLTWMIVMLLLPEVVALRKAGGNHRALFFKFLTAITAMVIVLVSGCFVFPTQIISLMFGPDYLEIAPVLGPYALATGFFALANVFVYYAISIDRYRAVWVALAIAGLQLLSFTIFHESIAQIVNVQIVFMSLLLVLQVIMLFGRKPKNAAV